MKKINDSVRTVAFYLPQFHAIPENDEWWGSGFTEWTNVRRAKPIYGGHTQPRVPGALGYYDLQDESVMSAQVELALSNGVDGFCFYHYWFAGKRLLETPVNNFLSSSLQMPFCVSWANENWSRRWDGKEADVLMAQSYTKETASEVFASLLPCLKDSRYIRVDGAALLMVHRVDHLPDPSQLVRVWREMARAEGVGELHLVAAETFLGLNPRIVGFDAVAEFPPLGANTVGAAQLRPLGGVDAGFRGRLMSYDKLARKYMSRRSPAFIRYRGVMPGWDNTARRGLRATVYVGSSPAKYAQWLTRARSAEEAERGSNGIVFVNAWNEWAEGAYLEPDEACGVAFLDATRLDATIGCGTRPHFTWLITFAHLHSIGMAVISSGGKARIRCRFVLRGFLRGVVGCGTVRDAVRGGRRFLNAVTVKRQC